MTHEEHVVHLPGPVSANWAWHEAPGAFERLAPPWQTLRVVSAQGGIRDGAELRFRVGPAWWPFRWLPVAWHARHEGYDPPRRFVDVALRSPFATWRHEHRFEASHEGTRLVDDVTWELPGAPVSRIFAPLVRRELRRMFAFRHHRTRNDRMTHDRYAHLGSLDVVVSGASGLIGSALVAFLRTGGHRVRTLVRRAPRDANEIRWDPSHEDPARALAPGALAGADVVIHLAGAGIADGAWTDARRREIRTSRTRSTAALAHAIAAMETPPRVFVSASATGYYGAATAGTLDESSAAGDDFLAEVCVAWEAAAEPARAAGVRTVHPRTGIVLSAQGGALAKMMPAFQLGAGGPIGSGTQPMSWIHIDDWLAALLHVVADATIEGPVNFVSPAPIAQRAFAKALGGVLRRPAWMPLPAFAVRAMFGDMGEALLLSGTKVAPDVLTRTDFAWSFPDVESALRMETGRLAPPSPHPAPDDVHDVASRTG